ncbi:hypothetical protein E2562_033149 [Oryza meyeriana var. granulata]|uniref:Uncharacterized protein n=1 Tax=Oryza meyeriana var. granulata TaxID=110450 RepID=A0A6G1CLZ9_9ORYZ|nr:hypothetical protein E2562_033149 [Oryza meyeriana var. granulata]
MARARIRFYPSHDDTEELRASLRHVLRIRVAAGATEVGTHHIDGLRLRCKDVRDEQGHPIKFRALRRNLNRVLNLIKKIK